MLCDGDEIIDNWGDGGKIVNRGEIIVDGGDGGNGGEVVVGMEAMEALE